MIQSQNNKLMISKIIQFHPLNNIFIEKECRLVLFQKITLIGLVQGAGGYGSKGAGTAEHPKSNFGLCQHLLSPVLCPVIIGHHLCPRFLSAVVTAQA